MSAPLLILADSPSPGEVMNISGGALGGYLSYGWVMAAAIFVAITVGVIGAILYTNNSKKKRQGTRKSRRTKRRIVQKMTAEPEPADDDNRHQIDAAPGN